MSCTSFVSFFSLSGVAILWLETLKVGYAGVQINVLFPFLHHVIDNKISRPRLLKIPGNSFADRLIEKHNTSATSEFFSLQVVVQVSRLACLLCF